MFMWWRWAGQCDNIFLCTFIRLCIILLSFGGAATIAAKPFVRICMLIKRPSRVGHTSHNLPQCIPEESINTNLSQNQLIANSFCFPHSTLSVFVCVILWHSLHGISICSGACRRIHAASLHGYERGRTMLFPFFFLTLALSLSRFLLKVGGINYAL